MRKRSFAILAVLLTVTLTFTCFISCDTPEEPEPGPTFTITFESNGGSSCAPIIEKAGRSITLPTPTKSGYIFGGWFTDDGTFKYAFTAATMPASDKTLYAKWTTEGQEPAPVTYTITFNSNGGSACADITKEAGDGIALPTPTKSGYTFDGWFTDDGTFNDAFIAATMPASDKTLYAKWIEDLPPTPVTHTITFNSNGGSACSAVTKEAGESITLPTPTKSGYTFDGWFTDDDTFNNAFSATTMPDRDTTLYAKWTENLPPAPVTYTITFNSNGGSACADITKEAGESITLPTPTKSGFTFDGWFTDDGTFNNAFTATTMPDRDTTVYANWAENAVPTYTITFDTDGGSLCSGITAEEGAVIVLPVPVKDGYKFDGWYTDAALNDKFTASVMPGGDRTLYAKWTEKKAFVRVDSDGNESADGDYIYFGAYPQTEVTDAALKAALSAAAYTVLPTGYRLNGWTDYGYKYKNTNSVPMFYIDVNYNGDDYRAVYFTGYRPYDPQNGDTSASDSAQDDNGYVVNTVYWFNIEPIKWRILSAEDGEALLLCESVIDAQEYHNDQRTYTVNGSTKYPNNYARSTIRSWLNDAFYNTAFDEAQKLLVLTTTVDNGGSSVKTFGANYTDDYYTCEDTQDKVFLLSAKEATDPQYGFVNRFTTENALVNGRDIDTARQKTATDYAKCQGVNVSTYAPVGHTSWRLRSPGSEEYYAQMVNTDGSTVKQTDNCNESSIMALIGNGVAPAVRIQIEPAAE